MHVSAKGYTVFNLCVPGRIGFMAKRTIVPAVLFCAVMVLWSCATTGASPSQQYFEAESCYKQLTADDEKKQYRSNWFHCIRQFETVHRMDPDGPWAAAGLYMAGRLYGELHSLSYKPSDLNTSRSLLRQVKREYPQSAYSRRADAALGGEAPATADRDLTEKAKNRYFMAESAYNKLKRSQEKQKYRSYWLEVIHAFEKVTEADPQGPWAAAGLFRTGEIYRELYSHSYRRADQQKADDIFRRIIDEYPDSAYSSRAKVSIKSRSGGKAGSAGDDPIAELTKTATTSGEVGSGQKKKDATPESGDLSTVTGIRYWSNPDYTRIVIDANRETGFQENFLKPDPSIGQHHERIYVDLKDSRLSGDLARTISIDDAHLKDVRAGHFGPGIVRVVADMKSFGDYNVFALKNPFRIVIDVRGDDDRLPDAATARSRDGRGATRGEKDAASIARQLALGVRRVVIDPGHGGRDPGALGVLAGVREKDVTLEVSKMLAAKIERDLGLEVILTRTEDAYLSLEERTAIANTKRADLFISVHANASRDRNAQGIETYFLNLTTDDESIAVAARENATSKKNISELQEILNDLMHNAKINESSRLATYIQRSAYNTVSGRYSRVANKGVKQAPFYVLLGAQMPSILIESGFITNPEECRRLLDTEYQRALANGIVDGIRSFIKDTSPETLVSRE